MIVIKVKAKHGLNMSHAVAITITERATPKTREIKKEASEAIEPSKKPMNGTHFRMTGLIDANPDEHLATIGNFPSIGSL